MFKYCLICKIKIIKKVNESIKNFKNRRKFCSRRCQCEWQKGHTPPNKGKKFPERSRENHPLWGTHPIPWNKGKKGLQKAWNKKNLSNEIIQCLTNKTAYF